MQVEISEGHGSEDFKLVARVEANYGYKPSAVALAPDTAIGAPSKMPMTVLSGLSPSSGFNLRVSTVWRYWT